MIRFLKQKNKNKNKNKNKKGFTLIETLVALSIFLISVVGMMSVLSSGLSDTMSAKKKMTATFLAQEGVEYMRNIRDTYVLYWGTSQTGWDEFSNKTLIQCGSSDGCYFNDENLSFSDSNMPIINILVEKCDPNSCPNIFFDGKKYNSRYNSLGSVGDMTGFVRKIEAKQINSHEIKITSTVFWDNNGKSVSLSESLFDWVL